MPFSFKLKFRSFRRRSRAVTTEDSCSRTQSSQSFSHRRSIMMTRNKTSSASSRLGVKPILVMPRLMSLPCNQAPPAAPVRARALHRPVDLDSLPRTDSKTFKMMCKSYGLQKKSVSPIIPDCMHSCKPCGCVNSG